MDESPASEPKVFEVINNCHTLIDKIQSATSILRYSGPEKNSVKVAEPARNPLEDKIGGLREHLDALLNSYRT